MENNNNQSHQLLHSYCFRPIVRFETQGVNEQVILILRAHPITQLQWVINTFIIIILLVVLNYIFPSFFSLRQIIYINIFGVAFILSYIWFNFLSWFFNVGIITSERIIDVDFHNVIYKEVTATKLDKVEDVTSKTGGYFQSFFDYGNVFIQTAGTEANIEFMNVPKPSDVSRVIHDLIGG